MDHGVAIVEYDGLGRMGNPDFRILAVYPDTPSAIAEVERRMVEFIRDAEETNESELDRAWLPLVSVADRAAIVAGNTQLLYAKYRRELLDLAREKGQGGAVDHWFSQCLAAYGWPDHDYELGIVQF